MAINKFPLPTNQVTDFTSSGTWTVPADVYSAEFLVVGAGGGGGGADNSVNTRAAVGGGGGGGAVKKVTLPTTPGNTYTITIGAKGLGGNATAGGNGGYSEVVLSGTTLIRSFGGGGGGGTDATDASIKATVSETVGGVGGISYSNAGNCGAPGGGGAFNYYFPASVAGYTSYSVEGQQPEIGSATGTVTGIVSAGKIGIDGFGAGGGGALFSNGGAVGLAAGAAPYGAGEGVYLRATGNTNGGNATIAGCGGGGAASALSTTAATGGDGFDGLVRISYVG